MGKDIDIVFLGTNGWYSSGTGDTVCILVDAPSFYLILDAGNGLRKADRYIKADKEVFIFLTHLHIDHISGLHILNKFNFPSGITICGSSNTGKHLAEFVNQPFTMPLEALPYPAKIQELGVGYQSDFPFGVEAQELVHSSPCSGYRFEIDGKVIAYGTDTGYCDNIVHLGRNADILITECGTRSEIDTAWPHLSPLQAAGIALEAKAKRLVLTHFTADVYPSAKSRQDAQKMACSRFSNSIAAYDELKLKV